MTFSMLESIETSTSLFPKNEDLGRTNDLINIYDCVNPVSLFSVSFFPHFDLVGARVLTSLRFSGNRLVVNLVEFEEVS